MILYKTGIKTNRISWKLARKMSDSNQNYLICNARVCASEDAPITIKLKAVVLPSQH
jgi:hypothetical protein